MNIQRKYSYQNYTRITMDHLDQYVHYFHYFHPSLDKTQQSIFRLPPGFVVPGGAGIAQSYQCPRDPPIPLLFQD